MAAFELPLVGLLSAALTGLASVGRGREAPAWAGLVGPGAVAWIAGVQGLLFRQQPDYMIAYLFEARQAIWASYLVWCAAAIGLAWIFAAWVQRAARKGRWHLAAVFVVGGALGLASASIAGRLILIGSTFEFGLGVARPLSYEPAVGTLLSLTAIGSFVPVAGAAVALIADGLRSRLRRSR